MPSNPDSTGIARALDQVMQGVKEGQQAQAEASDRSVEVEALKGHIKVTATLSGQVKIDLNPRAMRGGIEEFAEELNKAVNAALDAARQEAGVPGNVDLDALGERLEEIQQQSSQRLESFMNGLAEAHSRMIDTAAKDK